MIREGYHALVTGACGGIGSAIVLAARCKITAHDVRPSSTTPHPSIFTIQGDISDEKSVLSCLKEAQCHFGPVNILCANAGVTNEASHRSIWNLPLETWEDVYRVNVR